MTSSGLVYFDLSSIPKNAIINSAYLDLYCTSKSDGVQLRIGRLQATPNWTEAGVTWNNMPYVETPPNQKYFAISNTMYAGYDVKEFVQDWVSGTYVNNGFQLYTETSGGSAFFYSHEQGTNYTPKLLISYSIPQPKGDLQVTVFNIDNTTAPIPGENGIVQLYNNAGTLVHSNSTNKDGIAIFNDIDAGSGYYYKVFHNPQNPSTIFGQEYWGKRDANITIFDGKLTDDSFKRNMPYASEIHIFNNNTNQEIKYNGSFVLGTKLKIVVSVKNPYLNGSTNENVKGRLVIDRDKSSSYNFDQTSGAQTIPMGDSTYFTFYFTPSHTGQYYGVFGTITNVNNSYKYTDGWAWINTPLFTVNSANQYTFKPPFNGATETHTQKLVASIYGSRVGAAPSEYESGSGKIHLRSIAGADLFGGASWLVSDQLTIPFTVPNSGFYKVTFKGKLNGFVAAGKVESPIGGIGHCAQFVGIKVGIQGINHADTVLLNSLNSQWPNTYITLGTDAALDIVKYCFPSGWWDAVYSAEETVKNIEEIAKELKDVQLYVNQPLGNNGLSFSTNLKAGVNYNATFNILTVNLAGISGGVVTSVIDATPELDEIVLQEYNSTNLTIPPAPLLISPVDTSTNVTTSPTLSWSVSKSASSYEIQVSTNSNFSSMVIDTKGALSTSVTLQNLRNNTAYSWRVKATNSVGSSNWSPVYHFRTLGSIPPSPTLIYPLNGASKVSLDTTFKWDTVSSVSFYRIQVSSNMEFAPVILDTLIVNGTSLNMISLQNDTTYYWKVAAIRNGVASLYSNVWTFTTESLTSVKKTNSFIPTEYSLSQNYPNPFNPSTAINFSIPKESFVTLTIYDPLGRKVKMLVNNELTAGKYYIHFDASGIQSGVYFYHLKAGNFNETKKLILLK